MTINFINKNQEALNTPLIYKKINLNNKGLPPRFYHSPTHNKKIDWSELQEQLKTEFKRDGVRGEIHFVDYITFAELKEKVKQYNMSFTGVAGTKRSFLKYFVKDESVNTEQLRLHPAYYDYCVKYILTK